MKKLKVAIVIPTHFNIHSSLNNLLKVYKWLSDTRGIDVTIFTDSGSNFSYKGFKVRRIKSLDFRNFIGKVLFVLGIPRFYYFNLVDELKNFDVIESSNPEFYVFAYQAYLAAKKHNARLLYRTSQTVEGFFLFRFTKYLIVPIMKKPYSFAKFLLFTNPEAEQRCLRLGLSSNKSKNIILGHATDTKTFRPMKVRKDKSKIVLLSVGGLYKVKGHDIIINSLKILVDSGYNNIELRIIGDGSYKNELVDLAHRLGVKDKVIFVGQKSHKDLARAYNESDIFMLANRQEITPAVNEALSCEVPVVVMDCGGRSFVIPNESYGLISKRFDSKDMADKIIRLIKDKKLASGIAKKGRSHIINNFSLENVAKKIFLAMTK